MDPADHTKTKQPARTRSKAQLLRPKKSVSFSRRFTSTDTLSSYNNQSDNDGGAPALQSRTDLTLVSQEVQFEADNDDDSNTQGRQAQQRQRQHGRHTCDCLRSITQSSAERGGDMRGRLEVATRTTLGCVLLFSLLIFTQQDELYLGAVWIGNIFFHVCLGSDLGDSLLISKGFAKSVLLTTIVSVPVALGMRWLVDHQSTVAKVALPFLTFALAFAIMSCPWLTYRNLMVLVMYIVVAGPVRNDLAWHVPLGYCASYLIGVAIAIVMNVFPHRNLASTKMHQLLRRYGNDMSQFMIEVEAYTTSAGHSSPVARAAIAGIDFLVERMDITINEMVALLPKIKEESAFMSCCFWQKQRAHAATTAAAAAASSSFERQEAWIGQLKIQTSNFRMLRGVIKQRFLGEGIASHDKYARQVRRIISSHVGEVYGRLLDTMTQTVLLLNQAADPISRGAGSHWCTKSTDRSSNEYDIEVNATLLENTEELRSLLDQSQRQFAQAVQEATLLVLQHRACSKPQLAHLARRMTSFHSLFTSVRNVLKYLDERALHANGHADIATDAEVNPDDGKGTRTAHLRQRCCGAMTRPFAPVIEALRSQWLWHDTLNRRLALKTAVGLLLASLFVSWDYLWEVTDPFGFWPGLTIASVNLANRGSSFHKASDRLFGTVLAAAYAMLIADLFPPNQDVITIASIGIFTFGAIYLRNKDHAYKYTYAATSIGSMSYGSVQNNVDVYGYVPKRIQLIFVGVIMFAIIELLVFPRSSQTILERNIMDFFSNVEEVIEVARKYAVDLSSYIQCCEANDVERPLMDDDNATETGSVAELPSFDSLRSSMKQLSDTAATLMKEVSPALKEPYFGFAQRLRPAPILGIVRESASIQLQLSSFLDSLERLSRVLVPHQDDTDDHQQLQLQQEATCDQIKKRSSERTLACNTAISAYSCWAQVYSRLLEKVSIQMQLCCDNLRIAYPDGHLRPQNCNTLEAIASAASFRDLDSVRLEILSIWGDHFMEMGNKQSTSAATILSPNQLMMLGITVSHLLETCRHIQKAGKGLEEYARTFPPQATQSL